GGMGNEEVAQPGLHGALFNRARDVAGDIDQLHALTRTNPDIDHHTNILRPATARRQPLPPYRAARRAFPLRGRFAMVRPNCAGMELWNRNRWNSGSSSRAP